MIGACEKETQDEREMRQKRKQEFASTETDHWAEAVVDVGDIMRTAIHSGKRYHSVYPLEEGDSKHNDQNLYQKMNSGLSCSTVIFLTFRAMHMSRYNVFL